MENITGIVSERYKCHIFCTIPSRLGIQAHVPRLSRSSSMRNQSLYDNSFAVISPRAWNTLPGHLHQLADMQNLKNKFTDYLNSIPDNPHVSGYSSILYSCVNGNSLTDWKLARNGEYNFARVVGVYAMTQ